MSSPGGISGPVEQSAPALRAMDCAILLKPREDPPTTGDGGPLTCPQGWPLSCSDRWWLATVGPAQLRPAQAGAVPFGPRLELGGSAALA
jgi:hypothetical protein